MKVLVTGASGFVGNYVVKELLRRKVQVIANSLDAEKAKSYSWYNEVTHIPLDLGQLPKDCYSYFQKPDLVIHLAWKELSDFRSLVHLEENYVDSYRFVKDLVHGGLKKVVVTGTCLEYGMVNGCLKETAITNPVLPYALAKDYLRKTLIELSKFNEFGLTWIRLFYMYGPGQNEKSILSQLGKAIEQGKEEFDMSNGDQLRDYLPVEKVAENLVSISLNSSFNGVVNCCSGKPISIIDLVENFINNKKLSIKLNRGFYPYPSYEPMAFWGDDKKMKKIIKHGRNTISN